MSPAAAPRAVRRLLLLVLLPLGLLLTAVLPGASPAAQAQDAGDVEEPRPVEVLVSTLAPRAPRPDGALQVAGTVRNTGPDALTDVQVRLRLGDRLVSRSELQLADEQGAETRPLRSPRADVEALAPGASARFDLRTLVARLGLSAQDDGVYPLHVEVRGRTQDRELSTVGLARTFLPWFSEAPTGTTRIAWLWPVVDEPRSAPRATPDGPLLLDDELAAGFAEGGRLADLLRSARGAERGQCDPPAQLPDDLPAGGEPPAPVPCRGEAVPVTYAVDADLADTAVGMSLGYDVRVDEDTTRSGAGQRAAAGWVDSLRAAATAPGAALLALPYADVDVVALADDGVAGSDESHDDSGGGGGASVLRDDVGKALQTAPEILADTVGVAPLPDLTWAPPGPVSASALEQYASADVRTLVVSEDALPPRAPREPRTPTARVPLPVAPTRLDGLAVDEQLSRLLQPPSETWQGSRLAEQRWLVETAIVAAERPTDSRTLVVAPPRRADLVPAVAAQALLDTGRLPWLCAVPLADVVAERESCPAGPAATPASRRAEPRGAPLEPAESAPQLAPSQRELLAQVRADVDQFTQQVLVPSEDQAGTRRRMLRAGFRAESSAFRDPERSRRGRLLARLLADDVRDLAGKVKVLTTDLTLTSNSGAVTAVVENQLDQPVTVRVRLEAPNEARLDTVETGLLTVAGRERQQVDLRAEPRTSGRFPVSAQLLDRRRQEFGEPSGFLLRSTRYAAVALAVTGVGAGVLLAAAGVRLTRRALGRGPAATHRA